MNTLNKFFFLLVPMALISLGPRSNDLSSSNDLINDPKLGRRCQELFKLRSKKIKLKQKSQTLLDKNQKLFNLTPPEKKSLKKKLAFTQESLTFEKKLLEIKIKNIEETLIRQGCPGLNPHHLPIAQ